LQYTIDNLVKFTEENIHLNIKPLLYIPLMLAMPLLVQAGPIWSTGTPADDSMLPNTPAVPNLGGALINFDSLPSCPTFPPSGCTNYSGDTFSGITISSPDGLYAIPYSAQTAPNELFDNSTDSLGNLNGLANITVETSGGESAFGVGIADSDPVTITLQALGAGYVAFGPANTVTITETGSNPGNGYFVVKDTTPDIYGFTIKIASSFASPSNSGLAIDDVQASPEPSTFLLIGGALAVIGISRLRKRV
jgi:hypothetical protein